MRFCRNNYGFTLIEIIAVISLISILLVFAVPRFPSVFSDNLKKTATYIMLKTKILKESAVRDKELYKLHVSIEKNSLWSGKETASEDEVVADKNVEDEYKLPENIKIKDVEFPGMNQISSEETEICFYEKGYSDRAIIHIKDSDDNDYSFIIEPFLPTVKMVEEYVEFERD